MKIDPRHRVSLPERCLRDEIETEWLKPQGNL